MEKCLIRSRMDCPPPSHDTIRLLREKDQLIRKLNQKIYEYDSDIRSVIRERDFLLSLFAHLLKTFQENDVNECDQEFHAYLKELLIRNSNSTTEANDLRRLVDKKWIIHLKRKVSFLSETLKNFNSIDSYIKFDSSTNEHSFNSLISPQNSSSNSSLNKNSSATDLQRQENAAKTIQTAFREYKFRQTTHLNNLNEKNKRLTEIDLPSVDFEYLIEKLNSSNQDELLDCQGDEELEGANDDDCDLEKIEKPLENNESLMINRKTICIETKTIEKDYHYLLRDCEKEQDLDLIVEQQDNKNLRIQSEKNRSIGSKLSNSNHHRENLSSSEQRNQKNTINIDIYDLNKHKYLVGLNLFNRY
jgi:hypothetical protein